MSKVLLPKVLPVVLLIAAQSFAGALVGAKAPGFTLKSNEGKEHSLSDFSGKHVVLEWVNLDCPFVKKHYDSKNMQKLQEKYTGKDVVWLSISSSANGKQGHITGKKLEKRLEKHDVEHTAYLLDTDGKVGKKYGAKTTPHMFIIDPEGTIIYAGAIDDKPSTKKEDIKGGKNYVKAALNEALEGKEVSVKATKPYGCSVKY